MPSEKRARQRAAREAKRLAEQKRKRRRAFIRNGIVIVVVIALVTTVVILSTSKSPKKSTTTTTHPGATSTTHPGETTTSTAPTTTTTAATTAALTTKKTCGKSTGHLQWNCAALAITLKKSYVAHIKTTKGTVTVDLLAKTAPNTVNNFVFLAKQGFYNGNSFHRVIPGFMDQTGTLTGSGTGGPGYKFTNENVPKSYAAGDLAMANSGGTNTNGSQFFIVVPGGTKALDADLASGGYSLFGHVTKGQTIVTAINKEGAATGKPKTLEKMVSVTVTTS